MRSKLDPVDQPERTAHYDCALVIAEMLHSTIAQTQFCYYSPCTFYIVTKSSTFDNTAYDTGHLPINFGLFRALLQN